MTPSRRLVSKLRPVTLAFCLLLLVVAGLPDYAAAAEPIQCDKPTAEVAFSSGYNEYSRGHWEAAIPGLKEATSLCPKPNGPWIITIQDFGQTPYIPFFYLGRCHSQKNANLDALRQFYLSSCMSEPIRDNGKTKGMGSMTNTCLKNIKELQRYPRSLYFGVGYAAKEDKDWDKAAARMWDSMQVWPKEDGEATVTTGRWTRPYFPRFHLAKALYELGCQKEACEQLARSKIKELTEKNNSTKYNDERKEMKELEAKCAVRKGGTENIWICQQWQCWLQQDGRQAP
jgi:hypothetical protein